MATVRAFSHVQPPASFSNVKDVQVAARKSFDTGFRQAQGKTQNVLEVTLTANSATTTITDLRISPQTCLGWDPKTANAQAELAANGPPYALDSDRGKQTITVRHVNNAQTDRTFWVSLTG